jgi:predicted DNA-binding transcriptional regulator AlpA
MTAEIVRRIGIAELETRLGVERTTIWRWYRAGSFPPPHYLGTRRAWFVHEVEAWEQKRMARPRSAGG